MNAQSEKASIGNAQPRLTTFSFWALACFFWLACCGMSCSQTRRASLDETERMKSATISSVNQVVKPTPVQIQTTSEDGRTTTITTAPQSTTTHNLSDNTTASSSVAWTSKVSVGLGISALGNVALFLVAYVFYARKTALGRSLDRVLAYATRRATSINNAERREDLMHIRDIATTDPK